MKRTKMEKGITLVSLITTVIVLCILAATAIGTIQRDGLISKSQDASDKYNQALRDDEAMMQEGESILDEVLSGTNIGSGSGGGNSSDKTLESAFLWKSDDPSSPDYGVVIGYTENIQNYPSLRFPERCTKIAIEFPENVYGDQKSEMRSYTHNIKEIELPETVTEIGTDAFWAYEFRSLESITIPNSVTVIGDNAFRECYELTTITIPNSVITIGTYAFDQCASLESITIPNSVTTIENGAFCGCSELTSITIPDSVINIGWYVFSGCTSLTTITIPDSVTIIGQYEFEGCISLTTITIPDSVTTIEDFVFNCCSGLTTVTIPNSVTTIGRYAFGWCRSLCSIEFSGTIAEWNQIELDSDWKTDSNITKVVCTDGTITL